MQQTRALHAFGRHDQPGGAGHQAIPAGAIRLRLDRYFAVAAIGVVDDFQDVDLDERGAVPAVVHPLEESTLVAVQIVVHRSDIDLRTCLNRQRKSAQPQQQPQTLHTLEPHDIEHNTGAVPREAAHQISESQITVTLPL